MKLTRSTAAMQSKLNQISQPSTLLVSLVIFSLTAIASGVRCRENLSPLDHIFPGSCNGDICLAVRKLSGDGPKTDLYCLERGRNPHWREECDGVRDTNTTVTQCCLEDMCNKQLAPRLPSEPPTSVDVTLYRPINDPEDDPTVDGDNICIFNVSHLYLNGHPGHCYGDRCYTEQFWHNGRIEQRWGCLYEDESVPNITATCAGLRNTESQVFQCCMGTERCNANLFPKLPSELVTTATESTTPTPPPSPGGTGPTHITPSSKATSSPAQALHGLDLYNILTIVIVVVFVPLVLGILILAVVVTVVWKHCQIKEEKRLKSHSTSSGAESPVSVESDSSGSKLGHSLV